MTHLHCRSVGPVPHQLLVSDLEAKVGAVEGPLQQEGVLKAQGARYGGLHRGGGRIKEKWIAATDA